MYLYDLQYQIIIISKKQVAYKQTHIKTHPLVFHWWLTISTFQHIENRKKLNLQTYAPEKKVKSPNLCPWKLSFKKPVYQWMKIHILLNVIPSTLTIHAAFRHFWPYSNATRRPSMSMIVRGWSLSCKSCSFRQKNSRLVFDQRIKKTKNMKIDGNWWASV